MLNKKICKFVLTGGPCGGKTSALSWISNFYTKLGWKVLIVNEAATELITSGIKPTHFKDPLYFQEMILKTQLAKEERMTQAALMMENEKIMIVCDRGLYDNKAYVSPSEFEQVVARVGRGVVSAAVAEYDAVFHLVTTADGAIECYTLQNNDARSETPEEAVKLDVKTQNAWVGHPHLRIIKNEGDLDTKLKTLLKQISVMLGEPMPYEIERKYLIKMPDLDYLRALPNCQEGEIMQTYLKGDLFDDEVRVRQRAYGGDFIFTKTIKRSTSDKAVRIELERRISREEYVSELMNAIPGLNSIHKNRFCIMQRDSGQYLEIDIYPTSDEFAILEVEFVSPDGKLIAPDYLEVIKEVTDDERYYNRNIAANGNCLP